MSQSLLTAAQQYLEKLCTSIPNRAVGSLGNRMATTLLEKEFNRSGWKTITQEFKAMDWRTDGPTLTIDNREFEVFSSPYSLGCSVRAPLTAISTVQELETRDIRDSIVLLHGDLAAEPLMPKNFVFYNPESHQKIVSLLENSGVAAIITATGRHAGLAGGVYPFPMIEDGDFDIPSVYMTREEGLRLLPFVNKTVSLVSAAERIPADGCNVIAIKGENAREKIVITAHIDAKKGTPGAIDNATGVIALLLLAELLQNYNGSKQIELTAFNGEDYYAVPGQMEYIRRNQDQFNDILFNINIDGAGYHKGGSAFSFFDMPEQYRSILGEIIAENPYFATGPRWPQGDHSIFVQYGRPAVAITSQWFLENMNNQDITHTLKDNPEIVNCHRLVEIATAVNKFIRKIK